MSRPPTLLVAAVLALLLSLPGARGAHRPTAAPGSPFNGCVVLTVSVGNSRPSAWMCIPLDPTAPRRRTG